ncbi:hypothetical protein ANO11243_097040 [Dothideomycetidae sp. 11243]|nr:hypothetical protein ANO11243_097040 [fungal sp. No.11243]
MAAVQIRTGKIGLRGYLHRIHAADTNKCGCGRAVQTAQHVVTECRIHTELRRLFWPSGQPPSWNAMLSDAAELREVTTFILKTELLEQFKAVSKKILNLDAIGD